jgi:hypothetical protein
MLRFVFSLALASCAVIATADDCRDCKCDRCGCQSHCHKVCRVVCEMKEVKETHYCCKCEDFCVPGKSCKCGEVCEPDNFDCPCDNCAKHHCNWFDCLFCKHEKHRTIWSPSCESEMYTRNKLIKYQVPKKVPTYKWVVEYCCDQCECTAIQTDAPKPPAEIKLPTSTPADRAAPIKSPIRPKAPIEASFEVRATDIPDPMPPVLMPGRLGLERLPNSTTSEISWQRPE